MDQQTEGKMLYVLCKSADIKMRLEHFDEIIAIVDSKEHAIALADSLEKSLWNNGGRPCIATLTAPRVPGDYEVRMTTHIIVDTEDGNALSVDCLPIVVPSGSYQRDIEIGADCTFIYVSGPISTDKGLRLADHLRNKVIEAAGGRHRIKRNDWSEKYFQMHEYEAVVNAVCKEQTEYTNDYRPAEFTPDPLIPIGRQAVNINDRFKNN